MSDHCLRANDEFAVAARSEAPDLEVEISYLSELCEQVLPAILDKFADCGLIKASLPADPAGVQILERFRFVVPSWGSGMTIYERPLS